MKHLLIKAAPAMICVAVLTPPPLVAVQADAPAVALDRYEGFTAPSEELPLESYIDGVLQTLHVEVGDRFREGDALVSLDDDVQALAVEIARLKSESVAETRVAEARVAEAEVELESQRELEKTSSATPRDVRRAEAGLAVAAAELQLAKENQRLAVKQYEIEQQRLELYTLRATFDGEVLSVATEQGATEGAALRQNDPIMHLARLDPILAKISLPERVVDRLEVGRAYALGIGQGKAVTAELSRIASVADRGSQLIEVTFEIANPDGVIRSGVRCRLKDTTPVDRRAQE
ncbi:MAG: efflux RND transporter periplasmic adaptor subunit [Phycisphaeraceae bacterium]